MRIGGEIYLRHVAYWTRTSKLMEVLRARMRVYEEKASEILVDGETWLSEQNFGLSKKKTRSFSRLGGCAIENCTSSFYSRLNISRLSTSNLRSCFVLADFHFPAFEMV